MSDTVELTQEELDARVAKSGIDYLEDFEVPALFSSEMEPVTVHFRIAGQPASVTLRAMDADALAAWQDSTSQFAGTPGDNKLEFKPSSRESDVKILLGTVIGFDGVRKAKSLDGEPTTAPVALPAMGPAREKFFREMHPILRKRLVNEAKRVNGLHPLSEESEE